MSGVGGVIGIRSGILFGFAIARFAGWKMVFSLLAGHRDRRDRVCGGRGFLRLYPASRRVARSDRGIAV